MYTYFADTSFWIALSSKGDQYHRNAVSWSHLLVRTQCALVTTEAVLWEWMNAMSDAGTRRLATEGYRRCQNDSRIEVVPFNSELIRRRSTTLRVESGQELESDRLPFFCSYEGT